MAFTESARAHRRDINTVDMLFQSTHGKARRLGKRCAAAQKIRLFRSDELLRRYIRVRLLPIAIALPMPLLTRLYTDIRFAAAQQIREEVCR